MRELKSAEEKILDRALYLFGKNGSTNVPIRTIVKEAKVNVSAINYYFGSKDEMLRNVKEFYINNIISAYSELDNENLKDEEKIILCANEIMEYAIRYPGVLVMVKEAASANEKDEMDNKIIEITKQMSEKLDKVLAKVLKNTEEMFQYNKMIFLSSIIYPLSDENIDEVNWKLKDKKGRIEYIKYILKCFAN